MLVGLDAPRKDEVALGAGGQPWCENAVNIQWQQIDWVLAGTSCLKGTELKPKPSDLHGQ